MINETGDGVCFRIAASPIVSRFFSVELCRGHLQPYGIWKQLLSGATQLPNPPWRSHGSLPQHLGKKNLLRIPNIPFWSIPWYLLFDSQNYGWMHHFLNMFEHFFCENKNAMLRPWSLRYEVSDWCHQSLARALGAWQIGEASNSWITYPTQHCCWLGAWPIWQGGGWVWKARQAMLWLWCASIPLGNLWQINTWYCTLKIVPYHESEIIGSQLKFSFINISIDWGGFILSDFSRLSIRNWSKLTKGGVSSRGPPPPPFIDFDQSFDPPSPPCIDGL